VAQNISTALASLADKTKDVEDKIALARLESKDILEKSIADLKNEIQTGKDQFIMDYERFSVSLKNEWPGFSAGIIQKVDHLKAEAGAKKEKAEQKRDEMRQVNDIASAQRYYNEVLDYAASCIEWASIALSEVEYATLESFKAKMNLDALYGKPSA